MTADKMNTDCTARDTTRREANEELRQTVVNVCEGSDVTDYDKAMILLVIADEYFQNATHHREAENFCQAVKIATGSERKR